MNPDTSADLELEIVSSRRLDFPRAHVFQAFSDPNRLKHWWGPEGFTNTIDQFDFRAGGAWRFTMHAPDGADFPNESEFVEIVPGERIVFVHERPVHRFRMTMTYADVERGTLLTWTMRFETPEDAALFRGCIENANQQNFDRLGAELKR